MSGIRRTPNSNIQSVTINYTDSASGQNPQLQIFNSPGGSNTTIQFNAGNGQFGGSPNMIWNNANRILNVLGTVRASNIQGRITTNLTNFKLTGGNVGDTLTTDGTGNLIWVEGENYGNSNVANYLPNYSGNINAANINVSNTVYTGNVSVTGAAFLTTVSVNSTMNTRSITANGNVTANFFIGNGSQLTGFSNVAYTGNYSSLTGRPTNVSSFTNDAGYITNAAIPTNVSAFTNDSGYITSAAIPTNVSSFTNDAGYITVSTANVVSVNGLTGVVSISDVATANYANYSNVAYSVDLANVVNIGNIAGINLDGNASNILYGNGAFAELSIPEIYGNSNVANYLPIYTGDLSNIGNIVAYGASPAPSISGFSSISAVKLSGEGGNISNVQVANISGLGNIATVNLDGNNSNILYGNGIFSAAPVGSAYGNSNVATYLASFGSNSITTTGNITANNFSGNINITGNVIGTSPNVTLVAGSYTATLDNTGILTLPAGGGDEGAEIDFTKAPNSSLSGTAVVVDQYIDRLRFFENSGTNRGVYIDLTQAAAGVGTLLNNRVSGIVNAGTFVTMDNIKATLTTTGNRGLSLAATTGSFNINISGTYGGAGGIGGSATQGIINTTPSTSQFGWNFLVQGEGSTYIITDTTNNRAYRITLQIGASFNNNLIVIERLV